MELTLKIKLKLYFEQRRAAKNTTWEQHVHKLTICGTRSKLFNLAKLRLKVSVHPSKHLVPG